MENIDFHNVSYNLIQNNYSSIINFNDVDKILTDASYIEININNLLKNINLKYNNNNSLFYILDNNPIKNLQDFSILKIMIIEYYEMHRDINIILFELKARILTTDYFYNNCINLINDISSNIFNYGFIGDFYQNFLINLYKFNDLLIYFINNSNFISTSTVVNNLRIALNINTDFNNIINTILIDELNNHFTGIRDNFYYIKNKMDNNFKFVSKLRIFDKINYMLYKSNIGLNPFESNNILLKFDLFYNSFLYKNIYLDTIVLDIAKPDIIKPQLVFKNTTIFNVTFPRFK